MLEQLLLWLPNLVVALVILVLARLAANALAGLVRGAAAESGLGNPELLANIARMAVSAFGLGGRDTAGQIVRGWYEGSRN